MNHLTSASGSVYVQTNMVSDLSDTGAELIDSNLVNPWGVSFFDGSPFWVSDQHTNVATLYDVTGTTASKVGLTVDIPTTASGPQGLRDRSPTPTPSPSSQA